MRKRALTVTALSAAGSILVACSPVETKTSLITPATGATRSAGPGDIVMKFQSRRSLPNVVGKADLFGRTTNAGQTTVRYLGSQGARAIFERSDVAVESDATTMSESPMILPTTTNTNISGTIGGRSVSGTATSTSYRYIPPRGSSQYATATRPIQISLSRGESVTVEGRVLRVINVSATSVDYQVK